MTSASALIAGATILDMSYILLIAGVVKLPWLSPDMVTESVLFPNKVSVPLGFTG
jgi:hypothetical protein